MRVALLEEVPSDAELFSGWLVTAGHEARQYESDKALVKGLASGSYDVLVLGMASATNGVSSTDVLLKVRDNADTWLPVMCIAPTSREQDIVDALQAGADDCMAKPVRHAEFLARLEALTRRLPRAPQRAEALSFGDLSVDLKNRIILRGGQRIPLTPKSYDLAVFLFSNLGQLLSRSYLMERIWGRGSGTSTRTLDTHISRLRNDLGLTPENGWILQSVYQHGYRLEQTDPRPDVLRRRSGDTPAC